MAGAPAGNKNAQKGKDFERALRRALTLDNKPRLQAVANKLVEAAENGEPWAIQMVADRLDGKPKQQTEVTGNDGNAVVFRMILPDDNV